MQETARPNETTLPCWLTHPVHASFGTPPLSEPITATSPTAQTCRFTLTGTYVEGVPRSTFRPLVRSDLNRVTVDALFFALARPAMLDLKRGGTI